MHPVLDFKFLNSFIFWWSKTGTCTHECESWLLSPKCWMTRNNPSDVIHPTLMGLQPVSGSASVQERSGLIHQKWYKRKVKRSTFPFFWLIFWCILFFFLFYGPDSTKCHTNLRPHKINRNQRMVGLPPKTGHGNFFNKMPSFLVEQSNVSSFFLFLCLTFDWAINNCLCAQSVRQKKESKNLHAQLCCLPTWKLARTISLFFFLLDRQIHKYKKLMAVQ